MKFADNMKKLIYLILCFITIGISAKAQSDILPNGTVSLTPLGLRGYNVADTNLREMYITWGINKSSRIPTVNGVNRILVNYQNKSQKGQANGYAPLDGSAKVTDTYITSAGNWNTAYTNRIVSVTNTGSSGPATFVSGVLNIPNYAVSGGTVTGVNGTSSRITSSGGTSPNIDIASTYPGQTSITTLGTIVTGVWNATAIADSYIASAANWNAKQNALGYTPYNATNPSGYISGINSSMVTSALGYTPYNSSNPSGYITGYTETDPTVPSYSKSLTSFSVIKSSTDALYNGILGYTPYNATNPSGYISGINSSMVTTALGYTPYSNSNPSGFITGINSSMVTSALGYTPYNSSNPSGYITSGYTGFDGRYQPLENQRLSSTNAVGFASVASGTVFSGGNLGGIGLSGFVNGTSFGSTLWGQNESGALGETDFISFKGYDTYAQGGFRFNLYNDEGEYILMDIRPDGKMHVYNNIYINNTDGGLVLQSPNANYWRITVNNLGVISTSEY